MQVWGVIVVPLSAPTICSVGSISQRLGSALPWELYLGKRGTLMTQQIKDKALSVYSISFPSLGEGCISLWLCVFVNNWPCWHLEAQEPSCCPSPA